MLRNRAVWYALAVALQVAVLLAMAWPKYGALIDGTEMQLRVQPYDPMTFLSGRYVDLQYEVARLSDDLALLNLADGEPLYCVLRPEADGLWVRVGMSAQFPVLEAGQRLLVGYKERGRAIFGIESFFLPEEDATGIEEKLRERGSECRAVVLVDDAGTALLTGLMIDGVRYEPGM